MLKQNTKLIITILPKQEIDKEHELWLSISGNNLKNAYGDKEPEYKLKRRILIMKEGDIILTPLPQADGKIKNNDI